MAVEAVTKALKDARIEYKQVEQCTVGYVYGKPPINSSIKSILPICLKLFSGDSTCGQRALYEVGMSGVPIYNVNNNCSTGSSALLIGKQFIEGGINDCVLVVGFEKMERGSLSAKVNIHDCVKLDKTND